MGWMPWSRPREPAPDIRETKHSRTGPLIALTSAGRARWTPRDYASLASEGFTRNAVVYRCVRMIAEAAASTGLVVFADGVRTHDHPLARLLAKPNPEQSGPEWLEGVYPVTEIETMPDIAANSASIAFGDFQRGYLIVDRAGVRVLRDPYSAKPYVLFYTTKRVGGGVQNFDAIKVMKFAAS